MTWIQRANFTTFVMWGLTTLIMGISAFFHFGPNGHDFRSFYAAGKVLLGEGDPYDFHQVSEVLQALTGEMGNFAFYHPPWVAIGMLPFALLSHPYARMLWLLLNILLWIAGLFILSRLLKWPTAPWGRWLFYLATTYLFALFTWRFEQMGVFLFFLFVSSIWAAQLGHYRLSGVILALTLTKPSFSLIVAGTLLLWFMRHKKWHVLQGFIIMSGGLFILSLPLLPTYLGHLTDPEFTRGLTVILDGPDNVVGIRINTTFRDWLASFQVSPSLSNVLYILASLFGMGVLVLSVLKSRSLLLVASTAALVSFWLSPYVLQYDFPLLTLPLAFMLKRLSTPKRYIGVMIVIGILSVPILEGPISDGFWIVIGLTLLSALTFLFPESDQQNRLIEHE